MLLTRLHTLLCIVWHKMVALGSFALGATGTGALPVGPVSTGNLPIYLASDNGFVVKRLGADDSVAFAVTDSLHDHSAYDVIIYGLATGFCKQISTYEDCAGGGPNIQLTTQDGQTFNITNVRPDSTPHTPAYFGAATLWGPFGLANLVDPDTSLAYIDARYSLFPGTADDVIRSTDATMTAWTPVFSLAANGMLFDEGPGRSMGAVVADGYLWWIPGHYHTDRLYRLNLTTFTVTYFTINWAGADVKESAFAALNPSTRSYTLKTLPDTHRIYGYDVYYVFRLSDNAIKPAPVISIDITDPDVPVITFTNFEPFGANHTPADIVPLTNNTAIAKVYHVTPENPAFPSFSSSAAQWDLGSIWRTTDAGVTWTRIVADTNLLAAGIDNTVVGSLARNASGFAYQAVVAQGNNVFVAGAPPYVYYSIDAGLTWNNFTISTNIYTPYLTHTHDIPPTQWTGIALDCPAVFPGEAHYPAKDTPPLWGPPLP